MISDLETRRRAAERLTFWKTSSGSLTVTVRIKKPVIRLCQNVNTDAFPRPTTFSPLAERPGNLLCFFQGHADNLVHVVVAVGGETAHEVDRR